MGLFSEVGTIQLSVRSPSTVFCLTEATVTLRPAIRSHYRTSTGHCCNHFYKVMFTLKYSSHSEMCNDANSACPVEKLETETLSHFSKKILIYSVAKAVLDSHLYSRQQVNASLKCQRTQYFWYL